MAKDCRQLKKKKKSQEYFKYGKEEHIAIECRAPQIKIRSSQKENLEDKENQKSFVEGLEQA